MASLKYLSKEEIDILYSFANDEDCGYVYDWQGFDYEEICPLIDKLIKEIKKLQQENEKLHHYKTLYQSLKRQKEELRDYLKARIEVCDNRLSMPFCNLENATKERLILSQCLDKLEELEGVKYE